MTMPRSLERKGRKEPDGGERKENEERGASFAFVVIAVFTVFAACGREQVPPLVADVSGSREVPGLSAPVRVVRDRWGVPHIYARTPDDLFLAQGFVQAQDRLFQMDLWRRSAQGRLSEVLGPNFAERDAMTRRIQFAGDREVEWTRYGRDAKAIAAAFVRGVNAWAALARERPPEEFVLAGWTPEPWNADDMLNRTDAFVAGRDAIEEIFRARLVAALGVHHIATIFPRGPSLNVPRGLDPAVVSPVVADAIRSVGAPPFLIGFAKPMVQVKPDAANEVQEPRGVRLQPDSSVRTLPHPSPRYLVHLNAPGWNVIGATAPWRPGVELGHNDTVAWDMEPIDADTQDVYVERVNPESAHQVDDNGRWIDTDVVKDAIAIRGRDKPLVFDIERTRQGVILAVDRERHLAFTIRWSGTEPGAVGELLALDLDRASTIETFRAGLARWIAPVRKVTVLSTDRTRASEIVGVVPVRRGADGLLPAPAWTGADEWIGWRRLTTEPAPSPLAALARLQPARADALLRDLAAVVPGRQATRANAVQRQRAATVNALADAMPATTPAPSTFTHVLGISDPARRRFNVGPLRPSSADARTFAIAFETSDWDRSAAMNAPGQSASPDNPHFADLARVWASGGSIPLAFSDRAVQASAESTLMLVPARPTPAAAAR
jgi:acyl-homoserine lactone acylase PvdQ